MGVCSAKSRAKEKQQIKETVIPSKNTLQTAITTNKENYNTQKPIISPRNDGQLALPKLYHIKRRHQKQELNASINSLKSSRNDDQQKQILSNSFAEIQEQQDEINSSPPQKLQRANRKNTIKIPQQILSHEEDKIYENITKKEKHKSKSDTDQLFKAMIDSEILNQLTANEKKTIIEKMFYCQVKANQTIFKQGDQASCYFYIAKGQVEILIDEEKIKTISDEGWFGELALLYNHPRTATVLAKTAVSLWALDRITFKKVLFDLSENSFAQNKEIIEKINMFQPLTELQKQGVCRSLIQLQYDKDDYILQKDDDAHTMVIIKQGSAAAYDFENVVKEYGPGDYFGRNALIDVGKSRFSVKSTDDNLVCLILTREKLEEVIGGKLDIVLNQNNLRKILQFNKHTKNLSELQIEKLIKEFKFIYYSEEEIVVQKNSKCSDLIVVLEGQLRYDVEKNPVCKRTEILGIDKIIQRRENEVYLNNIIMQGEGLIAKLTLDCLKEKFGENADQLFVQKSQHNRQHKVQQSQDMTKRKIKLDELYFIQKIDSTKFGSILLCYNKDTKTNYHVQMFIKNRIMEERSEDLLKQYKVILKSIQFKTLPKLITTIRSRDYIFFVSNFQKGQNYLNALKELGVLNDEDTRYYLAQLILTAEFLHTHQIIHRDLCPENLLIDPKGYLQVRTIDTAKIVTSGRTATVLGTPHYMAPEIITSKGYTFAVDLWSIGIMAYEMICGKVPFASHADDPFNIYQAIVEGEKLTFPFFVKTKNLIRIITQLLSRVPEQRLGGSYASLKAHPFFDKWDWDTAYDQKYVPPYIPKPDTWQLSDPKQHLIEKRLLCNMNNEVDQYVQHEARILNWDDEYDDNN